jgi:hypothetical protein
MCWHCHTSFSRRIAETSRESVSLQSSRRLHPTPKPAVFHTSDENSTPNYDVYRSLSRIPVPTSAQTSKPVLCPKPAQTAESSDDIRSFSLTGEGSVCMSVTDDISAAQRKPARVSSSSVDLYSASGREGIPFNEGMQSPIAQGSHGDTNAVPQSPMLSSAAKSSSAFGSASPDSTPDSAYDSSSRHTTRCTPAKGFDVAEVDSVASLGSYLELEDDRVQHATPRRIVLPATVDADTQPSHTAAEGGFTFSALSTTPTHGVFLHFHNCAA